MGNTVKTTVLLAALSGVLLFIGDMMGGRSGLIIALGFAVVMNIGSLLVLGQDRAGDVPGPARRSGPSAAPDRPAAVAARRPADAEGLHHPGCVAERLRHRPRPRSRRRCRHRRHPAAPERGRARRRRRPRARPRQEPGHPDQLGRRDDRRGDHVRRADGALRRDLRRRAILGRSRRRLQPDRAARHDDPGPAGGHADPGGDLALA